MNLIICCTPLQVLIAEKIIELYPNDKFYGVMIAPIQNSKYELYSKRLVSKCDKYYYFCNQTKNKIEVLRNWCFLRFKGFTFEKINTVFCANVNCTSIQLFLSSINFVNLKTFDDGLGNLNNTICREATLSLAGRIIKKMLFCKYYVKDILNLSQLHYTIYKDKKNILDRVEYVSLFDYNEINKQCPTIIEKRILLGQPLYELQNIDEKFVYEDFVKMQVGLFDIDYYFPHPREINKIDNVAYIETSMIVEDYIIECLMKGERLVIYTFFSGAVVSMLNVEGVKVLSIYPISLSKQLESVYAVIKSYGIEIINID